MFEFAAFGFVVLAWWTWPVMAGLVFTAMWLALRLHDWQETRRYETDGPHPCLAHLGTEPDGTEWWCWLREGHSGVHLNQWGVDVTEPMVAPGGPDPVCLRSSNCFMALDHDGDCQLDYSGWDDYPEQNFHS